MIDPAGKLQIRIGQRTVSIDSSRSVRAASVFVGRDVGETYRLLPTLFSICGVAQSAACAGALEQALRARPGPGVLDLRRRLVDAETLREHLWRILLDWPRTLSCPPDAPSMARVMALYGALRAALVGGGEVFAPGAGHAEPDLESAERAAAGLATVVEQQVLGAPPAEWLASVGGFRALADWSRRAETAAARLMRTLVAIRHMDLGRCDVAPLPPLDAASLDVRLDGLGADDFVARPDWEGGPRETSPYTRVLDSALVRDLTGRFGNGLFTRLAAQLVEVAGLALKGGSPGSSTEARLAAGVGLAQVPAARGLLVHRVRVAGGEVRDYRILAPTEWNFHPRGAVAAGLAGMSNRVEPGELEPLARLFIAAVDPCVDFALELI